MKSIFSFSFFCLIVCLFSCKKSNDITPTPTKANIIGAVNLYNESTTPIDKSGMTVSLANTAFSAITNADGKYTLADIPFGTYTMIYEKPGFGTSKYYGMEHSNTGSYTALPYVPSFGQLSTTQITGLTSGINAGNVILSVTTDPAGSNGNRRYVRYFLSTSSTVSHKNFTYYSQALIAQINPFDITLTAADLSNRGFTSGQTVYVKAYGDSFWGNDYDDPGLNRKIFPNLNQSSATAISFVVP
jgi:hypothetical protein